MAGQKSLYDVLGLGPKATTAEIIARADDLLAQYRHAALSSDDANQQKFVAFAKETLGNTAQRARYDQTLRERELANAQVRAVLERNVDAEINGAELRSRSRTVPGLWLGLGLLALSVAGFAGYYVAQQRATTLATKKVTAKPTNASAATASASSTEATNTAANVIKADEKTSVPDATGNNETREPAPPTTNSTISPPTSELSAADVFKMNSVSIVVVRGVMEGGRGVSQGSGVVIADEEVITNCHVAKAATDLSIRIGNQMLPAKVRYRDQGHDLCQLTVRGLKAPSVGMAPVASLSVGAKVFAIGAPQGLELSLSDGVVSSLRSFGGSSLIQTTAAISQGSSGGGLFDVQGRLVGITTFQSRTGQNLNFAVPSDWIGALRERDGNTDTLIPDTVSNLIPPAPVPGSSSSAANTATENRKRLLLGKWDCHAGAQTANRQIQYEFGSDATVTIRSKQLNTDWYVGNGLYRLTDDAVLVVSNPNATPSQISIKLVEVSARSAVFQWQTGERLTHYCSR
jgi:serine protease Do